LQLVYYINKYIFLHYSRRIRAVFSQGVVKMRDCIKEQVFNTLYLLHHCTSKGDGAPYSTLFTEDAVFIPNALLRPFRRIMRLMAGGGA
jgi:hypothetical protein